MTITATILTAAMQRYQAAHQHIVSVVPLSLRDPEAQHYILLELLAYLDEQAAPSPSPEMRERVAEAIRLIKRWPNAGTLGLIQEDYADADRILAIVASPPAPEPQPVREGETLTKAEWYDVAGCLRSLCVLAAHTMSIERREQLLALATRIAGLNSGPPSPDPAQPAPGS
jgi:hypothetical protein